MAGKAKPEAGGQGPTYWDVERLLESVERVYNVKVVFLITCMKTGYAGQLTWYVRANGHEPKHLDKLPRNVGAANFRGNDGASTMPAAMYLALVRLDEQLGIVSSVATQTALF
jgi:hypothetical protein